MIAPPPPSFLRVALTTGVIADKAYDNNALRELIEAADIEAVIPSKRNPKTSKSRMTSKPTSSGTASSASSISSNTFDTSQPVTIAERLISSPPSTSHQAHDLDALNVDFANPMTIPSGARFPAI